jgi:hypothetical protein
MDGRAHQYDLRHTVRAAFRAMIGRRNLMGLGFRREHSAHMASLPLLARSPGRPPPRNRHQAGHDAAILELPGLAALWADFLRESVPGVD